MSIDIEGLLEQLTLEEKISLLAGSSFWATGPITRLGIPSLKVTDGPNGARGEIVFDGVPAACFPASVSLASTFNRPLAWRIGQAIGQEALTKGSTMLMGPTVCLHRSPLGGRNFESFSEDPILSGLMGAEFIKGVQSEDVAACVKHFAANEQETRRHEIHEVISQRALRELYLRPFEIACKEAKPWGVMTGFPKINGIHCDENEWLLKKILRGEWGWDGMIMSDWEGTNSTVGSLNAGLDLEMPGPTKKRSMPVVLDAIANGELTEATISDRARAVLKVLEKTRKFGDRKEDMPERAVDLPEHRALIREAGGEGLVLLKNSENVLPLNTEEITSIALIGPLTKYAAAHGGGSAMLTSHYKITPWDAFSRRLEGKVELRYAEGANIDRVFPALGSNIKDLNGEVGLSASYFPDYDFESEPTIQKLSQAVFLSFETAPIKDPKCVRLSATFTPQTSGNHYLSYSSIGPSKLIINKEAVFEQTGPLEDVLTFVFGVQKEAQFQYQFTAGEEYLIEMETAAMPPAEKESSEDHVHTLLDGVMGIHLGLLEQDKVEANLLDEAVEVAKNSDAAIVFVGNTTQWEAEGQDMKSMHLPADGSQDALISAVAKANPKTIVVNTTGVAIDTSGWIDHVKAFAQAWYAGQEAGNTIADIILGETNPSGKLPISWPRRLEDTAAYGNFGMDSWESKTVEYVEGIYMGYRDADKHYGSEKEVRFPFGFGLSYTTFAFSDAAITGRLGSESEGVIISVTLTNTGSRKGAEVVQVYIQRVGRWTIDRPIKELVGFAKVKLKPGETKKVDVECIASAGAYWDEERYAWRLEKGAYKFLIGNSSHPDSLGLAVYVDVEEDIETKP